MVSGLFFTYGLLTAIFTWNALRRPVRPGAGFPPPWLPAMVVSELAPWLVMVRTVVAAGFLAAGAAATSVGVAGLALFVLSQMGMPVLILRSLRSARETGHSEPVRSLLRVRVPPAPDLVGRTGVPYHEGLSMDLLSRSGTRSGPALVYLHPGSWMRGRPGRQAIPMFHDLARRGWVVADIRYPLSPRATFPEHLVGVKRAIAWIRSNTDALGVDPGRIAVAGASSGAHLAALTALTWDRPDLQPGFEDADTSVFACVPFYGIFDLVVRNGTRYDWPFVARHVVKATKEAAPSLYRLGSPLDQTRPDAPPFFVIHGELDSVVLAEESRQFVAALSAAGATVRYHEVHGAQHGFDAIASMRTRAVGAMVAAQLHAWAEEMP